MQIYEQARSLFREFFDGEPETVAYAPGRVEVLGNHTDYNEGFVLSSAIEQGTWFLVSRTDDDQGQVVAGDIREKASFPVDQPRAESAMAWSNYVKGVWDGLRTRTDARHGFRALFFGNVPLGAGLSSSAALEMSAGLALAALYDISVCPLEMARIGQTAEHDFAGVQCGLLDQITSLFGQTDHLVKTDFRSLAVDSIPAGERLRFLIVNTGVKHRLVDSAYNTRRQECHRATEHFAAMLPDRPIHALRDVTSHDWKASREGLDDVAARRALHVIGENERVLAGAEALARGDAEAFGRLMYASHDSSRCNFENSCEELDFVVDTARTLDGVLGARLSGGGFGGGAVLLVRPDALASVSAAMSAAYEARYGHPCTGLPVRAAAGARVVAL